MIKKLILLILLFMTVFAFQGEAKCHIKINSVLFDNSESGLYLFVGNQITQEETESLLYELLIDAIPWFEFPRVDLSNRSETEFLVRLSEEEINILIRLGCNCI